MVDHPLSFLYWYYILLCSIYLFYQVFNLCLRSMHDNFFFFVILISTFYTLFENIFRIICTDTFISGVITVHSFCFFRWIVLLNFFTSLLLYHFFIFFFFLCRRTDWRWKMYKCARDLLGVIFTPRYGN